MSESVRIFVKAYPRSSRSSVVLIRKGEEWWMKVHFSEAPEKGKANKVLLKMIKDFLGIALSQITLTRGHHTSMKEIKIILPMGKTLEDYSYEREEDLFS